MAWFVELVREHLGCFPAALVYSFLECFLIFLLYVDGLVSFFANEFARLFGLRLPCLLCTRLDHRLLGLHDPDFYYQQSLCDAHALDISFLAYCHLHRRLATVSRMCKLCLLSFAATDDHRLHLDECPVRVAPQLPQADHAADGRCSCCGDELRLRAAYLPRLVRTMSDSGDAPETGRSTTAVDGDAFHPFAVEVPYRELRLTSDTEEEEAEAEVEEELPSALASDAEELAGAARSKFAAEGMSPEEQACLLRPSHLVPKENGWAGPKEVLGFGPCELDRISDPSPSPGRLVGGPKVLGFAENNDFRRLRLSENPDPSYGKLTVSATKCGCGKPLGEPSPDVSLIPAAASPRLSVLRKRLSLRRNELESCLCDDDNGDGETLLYRLQRQVRLDKKTLFNLLAELDQERSASAVAAHQAMAMINRLQEEKAAVQMEALQYQRMMEEQAEYDQKALQRLRKRLAQKEREAAMLSAKLAAFPVESSRSGSGSGCSSDSEFEMIDDDGRAVRRPEFHFGGENGN